MMTFRHMIRRVRRRTLVNQAIHHAGYGILAGLGLGIVMLIADRMGAVSLTSPLLFVIPVTIGLIAGMVIAVFQIPDSMAVAVHIDRALHLQDQFGSAEALPSRESIAQTPYDEAFTTLVIEKADHLASRIDVRTASPIRITGVWGGSIVAAGALWLGILFLPALSAKAESLSPEETAAEAEQARQERTQLATNIEQTIEGLNDEASLDDQSRAELESLQRLADQLASDNAEDLDVNRIRDESAARLNDLAEQIAEKAERDLAASEQVARRFAGMKTPETPEPAEEFTEALKRGDLDRAANLLEEMQDQAGEMSDEEREMIAQHLRKLSDNLQDAEAFDERLTEERGEQIEQALRDQGLDETAIREMIDNPPANDDLQRELEENNIDEEIAQNLARDIERLEEKRRFDEQTREETETIAEALDQAARQIEDPPPPPDSGQESEPEIDENQASPDEKRPGSDQPESNSDQTMPDQPPEREPVQSQTADTPQQSGEESLDTQQQQQSSDDPPEDTQQQSEKQTGDQAASEQQQTGEQPEGEQPSGTNPPGMQATESQTPDSQTPNEQQPDAASPEQSPDNDTPEAVAPEPRQSEGDQQQIAEEDQTGSTQPRIDPSSDPDNPEGEQLNQPAPEQSEDPRSPEAGDEEQSPTDRQQMPEIDEDMMKRAQEIMKRMPADMLRDLAEQARKAQQNQELSEQMKQQARDMLEQLSEEQKQALGELFQPPQGSDQSPEGDAGGLGDNRRGRAEATQQAPGQGFQYEDSEDLDIRGMEEADQVIAEWLSDKIWEGDPGRTSKSNRAQRIRSAQQVAERAVNESVVPSRYHEFIKRYFDRLDRTVQKASRDSQTTPAKTPPAKSDAEATTSGETPADKDN